MLKLRTSVPFLTRQSLFSASKPSVFLSTRVVNTRSFSSGSKDDTHANEIDMLERLLSEAKTRKNDLEARLAQAEADQAEDQPEGSRKFAIGTYNAISAKGLQRFTPAKYRHFKMEELLQNTPGLSGMPHEELEEVGPHALLLRSFKMGSDDVPKSVRAVARCGAGVNNIDIAALTNRGIPVFNTPGANANAVKELVICSLFLASRDIVGGVNHVHTLVEQHGLGDFQKVKKQVEKDKKMFAGREVQGRKLGVVGLGHIGASVADTAIALGMEVIGYDPTIGIEAAWRLPGQILQRAKTLEELVKEVDYLTLHVPYMKETHHLLGPELLKMMKPDSAIINFARGELVDTKALKDMYDSGERTGAFVADFADEHLHDHPRVVIMPHLGASTEEAESNSAEMAANTIMDFIETGSIRNSVNFPTVELPKPKQGQARICIVNRNVPGMLGLITTTLGGMGLNIAQHINTSRDGLAYNAVDLEEMPEMDVVTEVQKKVAELDGVISSRVIQPSPEPAFFKVNDHEIQ